MTKFTITSSDYGSLHFVTREEYEEYKADEQELFIKHTRKLRDRYGYYAGNQDKYVPSLDDFNNFDSKPRILEFIDD